jgi:hypothetical protein
MTAPIAAKHFERTTVYPEFAWWAPVHTPGFPKLALLTRRIVEIGSGDGGSRRLFFDNA